MITRIASISPLTKSRVDELVGQLPGVRDGVAESVHAARVATRRLREILPMIPVDHADEMSDVLDLLRRGGRRLGRVRELDVMAELLDQQERRVPAAAAMLAQARARLGPARQHARRKLIKQLERTHLERIAEWLPPLGRRPDPRRIASRIGECAAATRQAVDHGSGVYFPQRTHAIRIAVKKLRYAVEVAHEVRLWTPPRLLKDLRRIQAGLGDIHDSQLLRDRLGELAGPADAGQLLLMDGLLRADIERGHAAFIARRSRLQLIADACARFAARSRSPWRRLYQRGVRPLELAVLRRA